MMAWFLVALFVQMGTCLLRPQRVGTGKFLSRPFHKLSLFKSKNPITLGLLRVAQLLAWYGVTYRFSDPVYFSGMILLYLDDYFTDDDTHKRIKSWIKNNIKWKMELPQTQTADK